MQAELKARQEKLRREQRERAQRAAQKKASEAVAQQRQQERLQAAEEAKRQQRLAEAAHQDELRQEREALAVLNDGVVWRQTLQAFPLPDDTLAARGIRRSRDKVLLPPSVGSDLLQQDAARNKTPFFEVQTASGARTHVSVLNYSAAEGTIALPIKVIRSLWGPDADHSMCRGPLSVTYKRLEKGTFVRLQPRLAAFQKAAADGELDMNDGLEETLHKHTALSEGDWISVQQGDTRHDVKVLELQPAPCVSVIDTEMEAEVEPSIETEERLRAEREAARQRMEALAAIQVEQQRKAEEVKRQQEAAAAAAAAQAAEVQAVRQQAKAASLPAEPPTASGESTVTCVLRFPDGSRAARRFRASDLLQSLFDFSDSAGSGGKLPGSYRLVAQMPRRVLEPHTCGQHVTLAAAGLQKQETIMLEPL